MFRGTTPTFSFSIGDIEDFSTISDIWVSFKPNRLAPSAPSEYALITKKLSNEDLTFNTETGVVTVQLSETETLAFIWSVSIQMKIKFSDGNILSSSIFNIKVEDSLNLQSMGE